MSVVTNLILSCSPSEDIDRIIKDLSEFHYSGSVPFIIKSIEDKALPKYWYGGSKVMERNLCLGAYNNLDLTALVTYMRNMKWYDAGIVQLIVKEQRDEKFKIIDIFPEEP